MDSNVRDEMQLNWDRIDFHAKRMVGKKEYQIKSELIATLTEHTNHILNLDSIAVLSKDQTLPKDKDHTRTGQVYTQSEVARRGFDTGYFAMGQDMLKDNWRKIE